MPRNHSGIWKSPLSIPFSYTFWSYLARQQGRSKLDSEPNELMQSDSHSLLWVGLFISDGRSYNPVHKCYHTNINKNVKS